MPTAVTARVSAYGCRTVVRPPFLAPVSSPAYAAGRYKNMIKERCSKTFDAYKPLNVRCDASVIDYPILSTNTSSQNPLMEHTYATGALLSKTSSSSGPFLGSDQNQLLATPVLPSRRQRSLLTPKATSKDTFSFRIPVITEKPEWWRRTLACVPYLVALQISDVGFYLQPFTEHYEFFESLIYFIPGAISRLPPWFTMVYCYFAYIGIVKNKDWPLFLRFHLMMGMLLETSLQIVWYTFNFFPYIHFNGRFGMHFWAAIGFAYIIVLLQCVKSALTGTYVRLPFISDAAFIHTLFHMGGYHRPF